MENILAKKYWDYINHLDYITPNEVIQMYTNIWGELVLKVRGVKHIIKPNPDKEVNKIDRGGHAMPGGFFNIDEKGEEVFGSEDFDEFIRIDNKVKLIDKVNKYFKKNHFKVEIGPNDTVTVEDIIMVTDCYWGEPKDENEILAFSRIIIEKVENFRRLNKELF